MSHARIHGESPEELRGENELMNEMNEGLKQYAKEEDELWEEMHNEINVSYAKLHNLKKQVEEVTKLNKEASHSKAPNIIEKIRLYADGVDDGRIKPYVNSFKHDTELHSNRGLIRILMRPETSNQGPRLPARPKGIRLGPLHVHKIPSTSTPKKTQHTSNDV